MFTVARRTFEAKRHRLGSIERSRLNLSTLTSEYMPNYKFVLLQDGQVTPFSFTTQSVAEEKAQEFSCQNSRGCHAETDHELG